ncbi:MAG: ParB/RepB/Spo0J family partition protein [Anaerolineae bacterium]
MAKKIIERTDQIFGESEVVTALFAEREGAVQQSISVDALVPNRFNPRESYSKETLGELIQSIQEHGFIGALDGRELPDGRVELAYGSRRLLAAKAAGIQTIPVFLHDWDDEQFRFVSLVENLIRDDLTSHEEAETIGQMNEHLGLSVRQIARKTGKPKSWVEDRLALYRSPQDVKEMVAARSDALRAASYIARVPDEASRRVLEEKVIQEDLTTRQVQRAVQQIVEEAVPTEKAVAAVTAEPQPPPPERVFESRVFAPADREEPAAHPLPPVRQPVAGEGVLAEEGSASVAAEAQPVPLPPSPPAVESLPSRPEGKETVPFEETASPLEGGRPSASQFVISANEALARFNPEAVQNEELNELRDHLRQLVDRASRLLEEVEARLQSA